jgi:hypothetical protein
MGNAEMLKKILNKENTDVIVSSSATYTMHIREDEIIPK